MAYSLNIGLRYLRSKKRATISLITVISIAGVSLGVAALLAVLSITSGFQRQFRDKVLGVNAHVLVLKYGVDFHEYRDVIEAAEAQPEVAGVGPFLINEMMLARGDRLSGVLVKGVDPEAMVAVLDLPSQIIEGGIEGLRLPHSAPPLRPEDLRSPDREHWERVFREEGVAFPGDEGGDGDTPAGESPAPGESAEPDEAPPVAGANTPIAPPDVVSPEDVEALLADFDAGSLDLPSDDSGFVDDATSGEDESAAEELPGLVLGATLAEQMELSVGDRVTLISPLSGMAASLAQQDARTPQSRAFRVVGIFRAGFQEYDSRLVYTDLYEAQAFFGQGDAVTGVEMRLHDLEQSRDVARRLERTLEGPFHTMDWAELNQPLFTALQIQKVMLSLVIATIIWVAAFNVIATLIMIVIEKKREIAILKAMGASDGTVLGIFMVQGTVIGIIGTLIGLVLGGGVVGYLHTFEFPLDPKVYLIDHLPVEISVMEFVITVGVALVICTLSTLVPSWWAARMLPVEGLRHD